VEDVRVIERELEKYDPSLLNRPRILAASKVETIYDKAYVDALKDYARSKGLAFTVLSAATHKGLDKLVTALARILFSVTD